MRHLQALVTARLAASQSRMRRAYWSSAVLVVIGLGVAWIGAIRETWTAAVAGVLVVAVGLVMHLQVEMYFVAQRLLDAGEGTASGPQAGASDQR